MLLLATLGYFYKIITEPMNIEKEVIFHIKKNTIFSTSINKLAKSGYISTPKQLQFISSLFNWDTKIKAGYYKLYPNTNFSSFMQKIISGNSIMYKVQLLEGTTIKQYFNTLYNYKFLDNDNNKSLQNTLNDINITKPYEGMFYPDTYFVHHNTKIADVLKQSFIRMNKFLTNFWHSRPDGLPFKNSYQAVILASLIEKETAFIEEKNKIASVFINRLKKNMRLQSDASVVYALGDGYIAPLKRQDLKKISPYNTYLNLGLPPTAISSVSLSSLKSVFYPAKTDYLYFVSKKDGSHHFSKTYKEHLRAIKKYK